MTSRSPIVDPPPSSVRTTVTSPSTPKGRRTREALLDAARVVFGQSGFVAARMTDVAYTAGLSLGALYRYFGSKEDLFEALVADIHEELVAASTAPGKDFATDPYGALLAANHGFLAHYWANRDVLRAFVEAANVNERFRAMWWRMRNRHIDRFVHSVNTRHRISTIDGVDVRVVAEAMACMVEQAAWVWLARGPRRRPAVPLPDAAAVLTRTWYRSIFDRER
jgi:AcrR family transcriptional regulator